MSDNTIYVKKYQKTSGNPEVFSINEREIWRYAGYMGIPEESENELRDVFESVKEDLKNAFSYSVVYKRFPVEWEQGMPRLPFECESKGLAACLEGSNEIVMFAATIGPEIDRHILKNERFAHTKALLMQAYGAERVESLCDFFCNEFGMELKKENLCLTPRFSPGYGDMPLEHQRDFFRILDISHKIGISLGDSLLMRPSKSVTAIFGIKSGDGCINEKNHNKCDICENVNCEYRSK